MVKGVEIMRKKILMMAAAALAGACFAAGITVQGDRKDALWNTDFVVTNVTADLGDLIGRSEFAQGTNAVAQNARSEIAAATNHLQEATSGETAAATNGLAETVRGEIACATNSMGAATDAKLAGYATKEWVAAQGYSNGSNMTEYAEKSWVLEQGYLTPGALTGYATLSWIGTQDYATKEWVQGRGYLTQHQSLAEYATKDWVDGKRYLVGTNLNGYAKESWVTGRGYVTGPEMRATVREDVREEVARTVGEMDGRTANRLMEAGSYEWIDGTGAVWRVTRRVRFKDMEAEETADGIDTWDEGNVEGEAWSYANWQCGYQEFTSETGTWHVAEYIDPAERLRVYYKGEGLPGYDGTYVLEAEGVKLEDQPVTPGQITENGWYQIDDGTNYWYVSPLVVTVSVWRVTNIVDSLATVGGMKPGLTTNDVVQIVKNGLGDWTLTSQVSGFDPADWTIEWITNGVMTPCWNLVNVRDHSYDTVQSEMTNANATALVITNWPLGGYLPSEATALFATRSRLSPSRTSELVNDSGFITAAITTNDVCGIVTNETEMGIGRWRIFRGSADVTDSVAQPVWDGEISRWEIMGAMVMGDMAAGSVEGTEHSVRITWEADDAETLTHVATYTAVRDSVTRNALGLARLSDIPEAVDTSNLATKQQLAAESNRVNTVAGNVTALWTYVYGNSVWIAVTNYMRTIEGVVPSFQLWEIRGGVTNCVYSSAEEIENTVTQKVNAAEERIRASIPTNAWSAYQSATGAPNPQQGSITIVSTPAIQMTGGGEWYEYVSTGSSSIWVLRSNGLARFGGGTNGFFRVEDDEGKAQFEVINTADETLDAIPLSTGWDDSHNFVATWNWTNNVQPVLYGAFNLNDPSVGEENGEINSLGISVSWERVNGYWAATVHQDTPSPRLFVHAKVTQPGVKAVVNHVPTQLEGGIMYNGTRYRLGTATIDGKTVLTLETW